MNPTISSSYKSLNEALLETESQLHPSEAHGLLCGILCGDNTDKAPFKEWVAGSHLSQHANEAIDALYHTAKSQLVAESFDLQLYLPDDEDTDLSKRAEALTLWCQGFLIGLKLVGIVRDESHPEEVQEAMRDLEELTKMQYEAVVDSEEDETAYTELVEYVRMAAMLIHDTLNHRMTGVSHDQNERVC